MRYRVTRTVGLHDIEDRTSPTAAGDVVVDDQVDVDGNIAGRTLVNGKVVEPLPRRTGWIVTAALEPLPPPGPEINPLQFYTFLAIRTVPAAADQRYLFSLAVAESGLKNSATTIAGSDAFGPFQYTSARWTELLGSVGVGKGLLAADRMDPFAQATLAILEEVAAAEAANTALSRPVQQNELYMLHLLPGVAAAAFLNAVKTVPSTSIDAILLGVPDAARLVEQRAALLKHAGRTATVSEALDAAAAALQPGLDQSLVLDPPPAPTASPIPNAGKIARTLPMAKQALARFLDAGWTNAQACGIIANIQAESGFDFTNDKGDGGTAYGLCQWRLERRDLFAIKFKHDITGSTFEEQLDFITFEMKFGAVLEKRAGAALTGAATPSAAAEIVCRLYERPKDPKRDSPIREGLAEAYALALA